MSTRGFAALTPERRTEISRLAGRRAHELGRAHQFTSDEARAAGRKGGLESARRRRMAFYRGDGP